ncbi:hypothetical protein SAMN04488109_5336 [Chryseolinea serpens]|uniref:Uncharacterized protein n=1 Tax=Chryseolinea serpens TaxID=947013 RepID=A0A1M5VR94_9BACT|nr:hypothetical protein [Chryseolinea serpens]SHH77801.1 hypothetical protein SAMN04488109_5336 [Chryseolinea serpens]
MNYNETEMPSQSEGNPVKTDPLSESIELIRSFALLEEDEDSMPVAQREIERAITIVEAVYAKLRLVPFFVVATRSGGVGVEYRIGGTEAYYHFDPFGDMDFSAIKGVELLKHIFFTNLDEAPKLLDGI